MQRLLEDKNIVVTGSNRGIGLEIVKVLAKNGANIISCARKFDSTFEQNMKNIAKENSVEIIPVYFDLSSEDEIKSAVRTMLKSQKQISGIVCNAGVAYYNKLPFLSIDKMKEIYQNNYFGALYLIQLLSRRIMPKSSIVFMSSVAGFVPKSGNIAYGGSKAAISQATQVLSVELSEKEMRVNAVAPGIVDTDMKNAADEETWSNMIQSTQLKRAAKPEEIANVVLFLLSDLSSYITGQTIRVDGGLF